MTKEEQRLRELHAKKIARNVAAELMGMGHERFARLCQQYGIDWPTQAQAARVTIDGITDTYANHAKRLGIDPSTLRDRMKQHGTPLVERNTITADKVSRFVALRLQGVSGIVAAAQVGHHYNNLHKRAKQQFPSYTKDLKKIPRKRRSRAELQKSQ